MQGWTCCSAGTSVAGWGTNGSPAFKFSWDAGSTSVILRIITPNLQINGRSCKCDGEVPLSAVSEAGLVARDFGTSSLARRGHLLLQLLGILRCGLLLAGVWRILEARVRLLGPVLRVVGELS